MERLVRPSPVAAILDIIRGSLPPLASERSFTCPVLGLASFQKKSKLARWISSSSVRRFLRRGGLGVPQRTVRGASDNWQWSLGEKPRGPFRKCGSLPFYSEGC